MKQKALFIIFTGLSMKQITQIVLEGESPTLSANTTEWSKHTQTIRRQFVGVGAKGLTIE